jgi:hypothetical protein
LRLRRRARKEHEQATFENGKPQLEGAHQQRDAGDMGSDQQKETLREEKGEAKVAGGEGHPRPDSKQAGGQHGKKRLYKGEAIGGDESKERKIYNDAGLAQEDVNLDEGVRSGEDERKERRRRRKEEKRHRHKEKKDREKEHGAGEGGIEGADGSERKNRYKKHSHHVEYKYFSLYPYAILAQG